MSEPPGHDRHYELHLTDHPPRTVDVYVPLEEKPMLTAADLGRPPRRKFLPAFLFVATCVSTFIAGGLHWQTSILLEHADAAGSIIATHWRDGLVYMAAVIGILLTHEMGHFLQTVRYGIPSTLPFFIPLPFMMTGTMGAVIGMEGSRADRKQLFDIGISGPLAGLVVAIPILCYAVFHASHTAPAPGFHLNDPLIFKLLTRVFRPDIPVDHELNLSPLLMAGWVGMLITGLNMMPVSQLDGGHVIYGLFGKGAHVIARAFVCVAIALMVAFDSYQWLVMLVLVLMIGIEHPPTRDDTVKLGPMRTVIGYLSLLIPVLCFTPVVM